MTDTPEKVLELPRVSAALAQLQKISREDVRDVYLRSLEETCLTCTGLFDEEMYLLDVLRAFQYRISPVDLQKIFSPEIVHAAELIGDDFVPDKHEEFFSDANPLAVRTALAFLVAAVRSGALQKEISQETGARLDNLLMMLTDRILCWNGYIAQYELDKKVDGNFLKAYVDSIQEIAPLCQPSGRSAAVMRSVESLRTCLAARGVREVTTDGAAVADQRLENLKKTAPGKLSFKKDV